MSHLDRNDGPTCPNCTRPMITDRCDVCGWYLPSEDRPGDRPTKDFYDLDATLDALKILNTAADQLAGEPSLVIWRMVIHAGAHLDRSVQRHFADPDATPTGTQARVCPDCGTHTRRHWPGCTGA